MAPITRAPRSSTWLWVLVAAAVLTQTGLNLFRPITSYKLLGLGADPVVIGLTTAAYALLPLVTAVWLGRMSDRIPQLRLLILAGVGFLALAGVGLALANSVWFVFAASAVLGMGHLCFTIGGQTAIARYAADRDLDKGFGWFTAAFSAGQMIGPALGGWIVGRGSDVASPERLAAVNESLWIGVLVTVAAAPLLAFRLGPASRRPGAEEPSDDDAAAGPALHGTSAPATSASAPGTPGAGAASGVGGSTPDGATGESPAAPSGGDDAPSAAKSAPRADERPDVLRILRTPGVMSNMVASLSLLAMIDILTAFLPLVGEEAGVAPSVVGRPVPGRGWFLPGTGSAPDHDPDLHRRSRDVARLGARGAAHGQPAGAGGPTCGRRCGGRPVRSGWCHLAHVRAARRQRRGESGEPARGRGRAASSSGDRSGHGRREGRSGAQVGVSAPSADPREGRPAARPRRVG